MKVDRTMQRSQREVMDIMERHGLYVAALTDQTIGLTDNKGNVYDVVIWDGRHIIDGNVTEGLWAWLGY
jgi:hypothetical protein